MVIKLATFVVDVAVGGLEARIYRLALVLHLLQDEADLLIHGVLALLQRRHGARRRLLRQHCVVDLVDAGLLCLRECLEAAGLVVVIVFVIIIVYDPDAVSVDVLRPQEVHGTLPCLPVQDALLPRLCWVLGVDHVQVVGDAAVHPHVLNDALLGTVLRLLGAVFVIGTL